jgi:predicted DNA repair protein MutK
MALASMPRGNPHCTGAAVSLRAPLGLILLINQGAHHDPLYPARNPLMAGSSLFALIDDIASILDDVAAMSKVAAKKTAGVLGDDLALNAQQVSGVRAERELPVVWAVAVGSLKNKAILVPAALAISAFAPWAITPLLMIGGLYLCFEGFEKIAHSYLHADEQQQHHAALAQAVANPEVDLVALEQEKIKGAVRTDFILSAEIIVIALGSVAEAPFSQQVAVVVGIALAMTVGVYGIVAAIVKMDDAGLYLSERGGAAVRALGRLLLAAAPKLMKLLSVVGTAAMFMVGGGILTHGVPAAHHFIEHATEVVAAWPAVGPVLAFVTPSLLNAIAGIVAGALALVVVNAVGKLLRGFKKTA